MLPTYPIFDSVCPRSLPSHWKIVLVWNFRSVSDELCFWWTVSDCYCLQSIYIYICLYLPDPYRNQTGWTCSSQCCAHLFGLGSAQTPHMQKTNAVFQSIYAISPICSLSCAHARVSVYKRKSNFVFFVEMTAFLLNKRIENGECHF